MDAFAVETIRLRADDAVFAHADTHGIPHLRRLLEHILVLQSGKEEPYGRRYQLDTIQRGELQLPSPFTGEIVSSTRSFVVSGKIFYWFAGDPDFYVASSRVSLGFPLAGLVLPAARRMIKWEQPGARGLQPHHVEKLLGQHPSKSPTGGTGGSSRVIAVMGNRNFAHHLWNELSALEHLVSTLGSGRLSDIVISHEPLGRIDSIFPEIAHLRIHRTQAETIADGLHVNLGSQRISEAVRGRVLQHARREARDEINALIRRIREIGGPVFWLSIRTHNPTLENQREIITAICSRLLDSYVHCSILFDGFSLPEDWSSAANSAKWETYRTSAEASRNEIDEIIRDLPGPNGSQLVANTGGIRLLDSFALAELADVYFCHAGSVHHKIGWTANIPGIVHGPVHRRTTKRIGTASLLDGVVPPVSLPEQLIENVQSSLREKNYRAEIGATVEFIASYFADHVRR